MFRWWNYKTETYEEIDSPLTDEKAYELIPQDATSQNLYVVERKLGKSILDALRSVLQAWIPDKESH